ncbi:Alpha/Beta hydrolase protein [Paraphysoderma sedebokerense]|nr:Alpha/Beta hydrolase protein [Paraphysoderma sedebokerense]KAI9140570.1 Alpha/Beta hydrolase protein [Paraphysoderma sedebokerense]KAI9140577.1 Alpha/Beta hydrolase protein [Paraphysoderma sedebokerense]
MSPVSYDEDTLEYTEGFERKTESGHVERLNDLTVTPFKLATDIFHVIRVLVTIVVDSIILAAFYYRVYPKLDVTSDQSDQDREYLELSKQPSFHIRPWTSKKFKNEGSMRQTVPFFLPQRTLYHHILYHALRTSASHSTTNMRRLRLVTSSTIGLSHLSAKYSLGPLFRPRKSKRIIKVESCKIVIKSDLEVSLPEDEGYFDGSERLKGDRTLDAEWLLSNNLKGKIILYFHGGGHCMYKYNSNRHFTSRMAETGADVLSVNYRLAPEYPFPAAIHDAYASYQFLVKSLNIQPKNIIVAGDSAGGNLALALLLVLHRTSEPYPGGAYLLSPLVDLSPNVQSLYENNRHDIMNFLIHPNVNLTAHYAGPRAVDIESFCKLDLVSMAISKNLPPNLPPILIQSAPQEQLHDSIAELFLNLCKSCPETPVTFELYDNMIHIFQIMAGFFPLGKTDVLETSMERLESWMNSLGKISSKKIAVVIREGIEVGRESY